jgi:hypothetical protein
VLKQGNMRRSQIQPRLEFAATYGLVWWLLALKDFTIASTPAATPPRTRIAPIESMIQSTRS